MADIVPYPDLPEEATPSSDAMAVSRGNAMWAKRFEGGTTNLAQRARHAADIRQYTADVETARATAQANRLATDKDAQNFFLRSRALDIQEGKAAFDMWDKTRKAAAAAEMLPSVLQARKAATDARIASTERMTKEAELKDRITADADSFHAKVAQAAMLYPEGPDYDRAILSAASEHHLAARDPDAKRLIDTAQKAYTARTTQAESERKAQAAGMVRSGITATGATTFAAPKTVTRVNPEVQALKSKLGQAEANQAEAAPGERPKYEPGLKALRDKITELEGQAPTPATVGPAAPATRLKLVGGKLIQSE